MQNRPMDIPYNGVSEEKIKKADVVCDGESLELFAHWIMERYKIHLKKDVLNAPRPWTDDPLLENYRFTNVRREMDRQTKYLIDNIVNNNNLTLEEKIINNIMFRCWNVWESMRLLGGPWTKQELLSGSALLQARTIYNQVSQDEPRHGWFTKVFFTSGVKLGMKNLLGVKNFVLGVFDIAQWVISRDIANQVLNAKSQVEAFHILKNIPGIANFLGYQIFVDCTYIPEFQFSENEFTIAGPGCRKGLNRLIIDDKGLTAEECVFWLRDNITKIAPQIDPMKLMVDLPEEERFLSVMSLENCLCEFSKYHRAYHKEGRPKNRYIPFKEDKS